MADSFAKFNLAKLTKGMVSNYRDLVLLLRAAYQSAQRGEIVKTDAATEVKTDEDGTKSWYVHGNLHREDGPAVEWAGGSKEWCLNGERQPDGTTTSRKEPEL